MTRICVCRLSISCAALALVWSLGSGDANAQTRPNAATTRARIVSRAAADTGCVLNLLPPSERADRVAAMPRDLPKVHSDTVVMLVCGRLWAGMRRDWLLAELGPPIEASRALSSYGPAQERLVFGPARIYGPRDVKDVVATVEGDSVAEISWDYP